MRKRDLVDGFVGPRTREMMDQMLCMNGMTNAEKVDFLMSRNREMRAENERLRDEIAELEGTIECLKGLAEANYERCDTCEAMLDCDECLRADASHKELRGLQAENERLRELVKSAWKCVHTGISCSDCRLIAGGCTLQSAMYELGIEVDA